MPHKSKNTADGGRNTFKLDTHPVQAASLNNDLTCKNQELDITVAKVNIGIGKINILEIMNKLQFGTYNNRAQNLSEESNALMIVIAPSHLHAGQELSENWNDWESLNEVKFVDRKLLILALGQHWVAMLKKMVQAFINEEAMLKKRITCIEGVKEPSDDSVTKQLSYGIILL
ncbi:uncharacterized protein BJ212DRAFT_1303679 [Suillus subaureus]|uniref:Uncharacterized protein n=1 Tax=Suillus subaureus TaxID=48587 RepID=A0A9P7DZH5_9AGAM|nr:uncharacterized protein BJ212DRAFT_1303679 [Suillus subaureus]KAG1807037.1 hypothetical protein BJ212DRAFT_1303679 [Suillus subaureus]